MESDSTVSFADKETRMKYLSLFIILLFTGCSSLLNSYPHNTFVNGRYRVTFDIDKPYKNKEKNQNKKMHLTIFRYREK